MLEVRKTSFNVVEAWWEQAVNTPQVARFLSPSVYVPNPDINDISWLKDYFISTDQQTLLVLNISRHTAIEVAVSLWSLHENRLARALACGKALKFAMQRCYSLNARKVDFSVLATNKDCLRLLDRKFPGSFWGSCPQDGWDSYLNKFVDTHHYSVLRDK